MDFPFVGAGEAQYFEWAELFVRFVKAPSPAARKKIDAGVPPPLRDTIEWDGPLLWVASEQGVGRLIRAAYQGKKLAALTVRGKFTQASSSADARFNTHIESWLAAAHAVSPILVAYRREDAEAGGTALSAWHTESLPQVPKIVAAIARAPVTGDLKLVERLGAKQIPKNIRDAAARGEKAEEAAEERERTENARRGAALLAKKSRTTGRSASAPTLAAALAKALPAFAKRLAKTKLAIAVRAGATEKALAAVEKALGEKLRPAHRALLRAFDGGSIGALVFLGTAAGGAGGADEIEAFTRANNQVWEGRVHTVAVVRTGRDRVIESRASGAREAWHLEGSQLLREYGRLDAALDAVLKAGTV